MPSHRPFFELTVPTVFGQEKYPDVVQLSSGFGKKLEAESLYRAVQNGFTVEQLYSTESCKNKTLAYVDLDGNYIKARTLLG